MHQRVCRCAPCNSSLLILWASEHVSNLKWPWGETLTPSVLPPLPPTQPCTISKPSFSQCHAGPEEPSLILAEKQEVLLKTDGGTSASTSLSGTQRPYTAIQEAAHTELASCMNWLMLLLAQPSLLEDLCLQNVLDIHLLKVASVGTSSENTGTLRLARAPMSLR